MPLHAKLDDVRERDWSELLRMQRHQLAVLERVESAMLHSKDRPPDGA